MNTFIIILLLLYYQRLYSLSG